jgi:CBS domain-containing protein
MADDDQYTTDPDPIVREIMRTDVPTVSPDDSVATVANLLVSTGLVGVPVVENDRMIGIVTDSDVIAREADVDAPTVVPFLDAIFVADAGRSFQEEVRHALAVNARQLMTSPVISIRDSATLSHIATLMVDEKVNPVPVLDDDDHLVGIIQRSDLVRVIARLESQGMDDDDTE